MSRTVISFGLSPSEIDRAIRELEQFRQAFQAKCETLVERVAAVIASTAQTGFNGAVVDDLTELSGGPRMAHVEVRTEKRGDTYVVIADGQDAVWVEFGAGVYHNGSAGQSPNPWSAQNNLGFTIGGFGEKGKRNLWAFKDSEGVHFTHGTPSNMPMYNAVQAVRSEIAAIAQEVFG